LLTLADPTYCHGQTAGSVRGYARGKAVDRSGFGFDEWDANVREEERRSAGGEDDGEVGSFCVGVWRCVTLVRCAVARLLSMQLVKAEDTFQTSSC